MNPALPTQDSTWVNACSELMIAAIRLQEQLPAASRQALVPVVAHMNCYYSNLIEGHKTYPDEVESAVLSNSSPVATAATDPRAMLVAEAQAHINAQADLRARLASEPSWDPVTSDALAWMHRAFYGHLPEVFRWTETRDGTQRVPIIPGAWRNIPVHVGEHVPPEVKELSAFLARFAEAYSGCTTLNPQNIAVIAASHHRFAWIHPFVDGNGRVARLLTDALVERCGLGANGLWCVGRGFARNLDRYRALLAEADGERHGDTDGRGPRTQAGLNRWCAFALEVMLDQVRFMHGLIQPASLRQHIAAWTERESAHGRLHPRAGRLIANVVCAGPVSRTEATEILQLTDRYGREQIRILLEQGLLVADEREPLRPAFPLHVVPWWFPDLFPGDVEQRLMTTSFNAFYDKIRDSDGARALKKQQASALLVSQTIKQADVVAMEILTQHPISIQLRQNPLRPGQPDICSASGWSPDLSKHATLQHLVAGAHLRFNLGSLDVAPLVGVQYGIEAKTSGFVLEIVAGAIHGKELSLHSWGPRSILFTTFDSVARAQLERLLDEALRFVARELGIESFGDRQA